MKLEQDIQKRFIRIVTSLEDECKRSKEHEIYNELIYYSFVEVIEKAFPRFRKRVSEEVFKHIIYDFINFGAKNPLYFKAAKEFRDFLVFKNNLEIVYLEDLLNFEYLEVEMYMTKYSEFEHEEFSLDMPYRLSNEIRIETYNYPIHNPEFDTNPDAFDKGEYSVLFYYDAKNEQILSEEISPFIKEFLSALDAKQTLNEQIKVFSIEYEIEFKELLEILSEVLEEYHSLNIITKV